MTSPNNNISVRQFSHKSFSEHLFATLEKYQFSPSCLTLEITESLFIEEVAIVKPLFDALKENDIKMLYLLLIYYFFYFIIMLMLMCIEV